MKIQNIENNEHHELSLKYGGTNTMSNLFPLPEKIHDKAVSPWWGYINKFWRDKYNELLRSKHLIWT